MEKEDHHQSDLGMALFFALEMAILVRKEPMVYELYGEPPSFYQELFPGDDGRANAEPWNKSFMLESFVEDCEELFESSSDEPLYSGYWVEEDEETGEETPLVAWGRKVDGRNILIIQRVSDEYAERARILRQARSMLLERRAMSADLVSFRRKALYDPLTQVYNRNGFTEFLEKLTSAGSNAPGLALLMLDLDDFKKVNDDLGHVVGDQVLSQLGRILRESLRTQDTPVRYGGEEFLVLTAGSTLAQAFVLGEKLRFLVENHDFGIGRPVTISIGGTLYNVGEGVDDFISRADRALYDSKRSGKNQVSMHEPWTDLLLKAEDFRQLFDESDKSDPIHSPI